MAETSHVEQLLRSALVPVEPPQSLTDRLERRLSAVAGSAADELAEWELSAMRDPRNWVRPVAALVVGGLAGSALVIVRARQQQKDWAKNPARSVSKRAANPARSVSKTLRGAPQSLRKRVRR